MDPFVVGKRYRIRKDFQALRDTFKEGEVMTYDQSAYSRYDGYTGYFFTQEGQAGLRLWDIHDTDDLKVWKELFEPLPDAPLETPPPPPLTPP